MDTSFVIFIACLLRIVQSKSHYVIDIHEFEWNVTNKDVIEVQLQVVQFSRGVTGLEGFIDVKKDVNTDKVTSSVDIYYSKTGVSYMLTPFRSPPSKLTFLFNVMYKEYAMSSLEKCCENPVVFEDKLDPPILTKRKITFTNCVADTEDYVSNMRLGYYRLEGRTTGEFESTLKLVVYLDLEEIDD